MTRIRVFIRYENGSYKLKKVPISINVGIQGLSFEKVIENVFGYAECDEKEMPQLLKVKNTEYSFGDTCSELACYKVKDKKDVEDSRLLFFRKAILHNNPLSDIFPIYVDLLDSDVDYLKKFWTHTKT
ncbi:hypothetical protein LCM23_02960 [Cytobacillus kochii]|uniref:hypothetical protein n=1 Tax=Cytobacillus kochii TaxID=859143 RepID=UPI001CD214D6|nr:hypothetical protein [Cytobacillus kochii]MCA1025036.1 hypothetical protein [Cytobacillus kochii]